MSAVQPALSRFSEPTRTWFAAAFAEPTPAQVGAWEAIGAGQHALVVAPTGSGKTLSAFLWSLDRLLTSERPADRAKRTRVLYVSPLKALAVDVERNLRSPLTGIRHTGDRLGQQVPEVTVGVRSGDTPAADRRRLVTQPPDIMITTPESLFLMLTSQARESLRGVETVIVDEVHAVAGTKRGAHLAVTLERLDALLDKPAQRIGLSATVRPLEEVARFLGGSAPVEIVAPPSTKEWDLQVVVPVEDMTQPGEYDEDSEEPTRAQSIWPHVEEHVVDLIEQHKSTIVFANSRRLAERLTARLNEIATERATGEPAEPHKIPAEIIAQSGSSRGIEAVIAKAHHGSVSKEQRALIEDDLKRGRLPAVVATSSLELGIDMGAVDLVIQIESPPSVASALQRVGRAGHQVGEVSRGVLFPKHRGDLAQTAVAVQRMRSGSIESLSVPTNPLDVLAQQVVAATAMDGWPVDDLYDLMKRTAAFAKLPRSAYDAVLDLLSGRYPSDEFAELRPRIVWDRVTGTLTGRPGAQRLAVTSGGTIPDRGLFGVFLVGGEGPGKRVGELDEEMVYESRVGDVFALGATSWRIEDITHDRVLVTPAPGVPGRLPFWKGDALGRPAELGEAVGAFTRELAAMPKHRAEQRAMAEGLDSYAAANLVGYLHEQLEATQVLPSDQTLLVERFRDELGDWRLVVHSPYGTPVHAPWALAINARLRERYGIDGQAVASDDGIVIRIPDTDAEAPGGEVIVFSPDEIDDLVTQEVGGSALFASRFRECAARALLLPRRDPGRRSPLWQQRQRSAAAARGRQPLPVVPDRPRGGPRVPPGRLRPARAGRADAIGRAAQGPGHRRRRRRARAPSRAACSSGTSPSSSTRATPPSPSAGPPRCRSTRGCSPSCSAGPSCASCSTPRCWPRSRPSSSGSRPSAGRGAPRASPTCSGCSARSPPRRSGADRATGSTRAKPSPRSRSRVVPSRSGSPASSAGPRSRTSAGSATGSASPSPPARPTRSPIPSTTRSPTWSPATPAPTARSPPTTSPTRLGLGTAVVRLTLQRLGAQGRVLDGEFRPGASGLEWCDAEVLRSLRRRSLARLRKEVEPVPPAALGRFLSAWQHVDGKLRGVDGVLVRHRPARRCAGAGQRPRATRAGRPGPRLRAVVPRRAHRLRRGALGRPRLAARCRRLGLAPPRRPGAAHAPRARALRAQ